MRNLLFILATLVCLVALAPFKQSKLSAHELIQVNNFIDEETFNTCQIRGFGTSFWVQSRGSAYDIANEGLYEAKRDTASSSETVDTSLSSSVLVRSGNIRIATNHNGSVTYELFNQSAGNLNSLSSYVNGAQVNFDSSWDYFVNNSHKLSMSLATVGYYRIYLEPQIDGVVEINYSASSGGEHANPGSIGWMRARPWRYDPLPLNGNGIVTKTVVANSVYTLRLTPTTGGGPVGNYREPYYGFANTTFAWKFIPTIPEPAETMAIDVDMQAGNQMRITNIELNERSVENNGEWQKADSSTVDGNIVRISVDIKNEDFIGLAQLAFFNAETDELIGTIDNLEFPAENDDPYHFEWDTTGYAWLSDDSPRLDPVPIKVVLSHCVDGEQQIVDEETTDGVLVKPKPVILVHGLWSNSLTWGDYLRPGPISGFLKNAHPNWFGYAADTLFTGREVGDQDPINLIHQNARLLAEEIQFVRESQNAWRVDIVAHSMGGLISRAYIDEYMPSLPFSELDPVIDHLVMLGTPNMGSPCADLFNFPSMIELRTDIMSTFNTNVTDWKFVQFSNFVGNGWFFTCDSPEAGDMVVPVSSARWVLLPNELMEGGIRHDLMTGSEFIFDNYVLPRLQGSSDNAALQARENLQIIEQLNEASVTTESLDPQLLMTEQIQVPATASQEIDIAVPETTAFGLTFSGPPSVGIELLDPSNSIVGEYLAYGPDANLLFRTLRVENPEVGNWVVRIENQDSNLAHSLLALWIDDSPVQLDLEEHVENKNLQLTVTLTEENVSITDALVSADIIDFEGNRISATLFDDGLHNDFLANDGVYGVTMGVSPGLYSIRVRAEGVDFIRYTTGAIQVPEENDGFLYLPVVYR
jgi:pimeloyl-ACP methyl ester carboxylesterase